MSYPYKYSIKELEEIFSSAADDDKTAAAERLLVGIAVCERLEALFAMTEALYRKIATEIENRK